MPKGRLSIGRAATLFLVLTALYPVAASRAADDDPPPAPVAPDRPESPESPAIRQHPDAAPETAVKPTSPAPRNRAAQWASLADQKDDSLLTKAAELGLLDVKLQAVHEQYRRDQRAMADLKASGLGENHPDIHALKAGLDQQRRQLAAGVNQLKQNAADADTLLSAQLAVSTIPVFHLTPAQASGFDWGTPSEGLRLALARPESVGEKPTEAAFDYRMIIQNVSDRDIRFDLAQIAAEFPRLNLHEDGRVLAAFTGQPFAPKEILLPSNAAASVPLFPNRLLSPAIRVWDPSLTLSVELELAPSPGSWSGRLASADTLGLLAPR